MVERVRSVQDAGTLDAHPATDAALPRQSPLLLAMRTLLLVVVVFFTAGAALQVLHAPIGMWLSTLLVFLGLPLVLVLRSGRAPFAYPGLVREGLWPMLLIGFVLGTLNYFALVTPLQLLMHEVMPDSWVRFFDGSKLFEQLAPWELYVVLAAVALAAPFCEEYFFRGVLQQGLQRSRLSPVSAVLIAAVIFSLMHGDPVGFLARVELGVLFGLLYLRTGSLWPAIGAHMANNVVSALLYLAGRNADLPADAAEPGLEAIAAVAGLSGLLLLALLWAVLTAPALLPPRAPHAEAPARPIPDPALPWGLWAGAMCLSLMALGALAAFGPKRLKAAVEPESVQQAVPPTAPAPAP